MDMTMRKLLKSLPSTYKSIDSDIFVCAQCGHDIFIEKGTYPFAGLQFKALECENCGNHSLLETNEYEFDLISSKNDVYLPFFKVNIKKL
jgi:transcription elongation factor Elf1